jgi:hypothetical protein
MKPGTAVPLSPDRFLAILLVGAASITSATAQESFHLYERNALAGNYTAQRNAAYCLKTAKCDRSDPPASPDAIMRKACSYRGENPGPGKDAYRELDPKPGIREQPRSRTEILDSIANVLSQSESGP